MTEHKTSRNAAAKTDREKPDPADKSAQPAWAWPGFASIAGPQFGGVKAMSEVSTLFIRTAQDLAARQADFIKANAETAQHAAGLYGESDPAKRLAGQSELYRELVERSADHVSSVAKAISGFCCEAMEQMTDAATTSAEAAPQKNASQESRK